MYMTACPHTLESGSTMSQAHAIMMQRQIRHIPVMSARKLAGLVTLSDLLMAEAISNIDPTRVRVDVVMARNVYAAPPSAPIDEFVQVMAREKYGSTVVIDRDEVVGVFTVIDVCHALADLLRQD